MEEAKEFIAKSTKLRTEGRLDEAVIAARKAISIDADDANAWWQLALAIVERDGVSSAKKELEKVTQLAPHFSGGWCELGQSYEDDDIDEAIKCYESSIAQDAEHIRTLKLLSAALDKRGQDGDRKYRLDLLRALQHLQALSISEQFDLGYELLGQREFLDAARAFESYTQENPSSSALHNLGLAYQNIGRAADAIDAYRYSLFVDSQGSASKLVQEKLARLLPHALALGQRISSKPQPFLSQGDWFKHYVNPFVLLGVKAVADVQDNPKALQRAKQTLYREIELEDGVVDWMPGLSMDKSAAMSICESLSVPESWRAHRDIFENQALCEFLGKGHLGYFLVKDSPPSQVVLPHLIEESLRNTVSARFAEQYNLVLTKAIEQGDVDAVECLLDGRRLVLPEHQERCFEGARRALEQLYGPLEKLADESQENFAEFEKIERTLQGGKLDRMMALLPVEFYDIHAAVCRALRRLSISFYNNKNDAEIAKSILKLGKVFADKSPSLSHQFVEDEKLLDEKIADEKKNEARLTLRNENFSITKVGIVHGAKRISTVDVEAARWGMTITSNTPRTFRFNVAYKDARGQSIELEWSASKDLDEQRGLWGQLVTATLHYLLDDLLLNFKKRLKAGIPTRVGGLEVTEHGVIFEISGWFSNTKELCSWSQLISKLEGGAVVLRSASNRKAKMDIPLATTDNAFLLHVLAAKKED
jgi:tetratricopeptide (TPR) repeat protein